MKIIVGLLGKLLRRLEYVLASGYIKQLKSAGKNIFIARGVQIEHPECVTLGDDVYLNEQLWISIFKEDDKFHHHMYIQPELIIGEGSYIGRFGTIACINRVCIGKNVLISDRVFIGDALHGFERTDIPIKEQKMTSPGPVEIGDGTWVGISASILPNVSIGKNCVIGANSVVTHDIPDFCVAAGNPARVLRKIG